MNPDVFESFKSSKERLIDEPIGDGFPLLQIALNALGTHVKK
jgi:hypothetical protein